MENFKSPVPVVWSSQRVLTTAQLAKYYECPVEYIRDNFRKNRDRFVAGRHFFKLEGEALKTFRDYTEEGIFPVVPARTPSLYLWTAAGIFLHCKMINTPQAWELFSKIGETLSIENHPLLNEVIFGKIKPLEAKPDLVYVYAIEFDNGFVKIGMSNDVDKRKGDICHKLQFKALRTYHTDFMSRQKAHQIEKICHKFFHDCLAYRHEYFYISFDEACKAVEYFAKLVAAAPIVSDLKRGGKILKLVDRKFD